jgi:hypothetical protein
MVVKIPLFILQWVRAPKSVENMGYSGGPKRQNLRHPIQLNGCTKRVVGFEY